MTKGDVSTNFIWLVVALATTVVCASGLANQVIALSANSVINLRSISPLKNPALDAFAAAVFDAQKIYWQNHELTQQLRGLVQKSTELSAIQKQNEFLREQLNLTPGLRQMEQGVLANVLIQDGSKLVIKSEKRLQTGDWVFLNGYLVGKITRVSELYAQAILITDSDFQSIVRVGSQLATLRGSNGIGLELVNKANNFKAKSGDLVFLSNSENLDLSQIPIAVISKDLGVKLPFDLDKISEVIVYAQK